MSTIFEMNSPFLQLPLVALAFLLMSACDATHQQNPARVEAGSEPTSEVQRREVSSLASESLPRSENSEKSPALVSTSNKTAGLLDAELQSSTCASGQCVLFPSAAAAFAKVIRETQPLVIGFGEAHQREGDNSPSTAQRFLFEIFLPLSPYASGLLLEILSPPEQGCAGAEAQARKQTAVIAGKQSGDNQQDYIALGRKSRSLGMRTELLQLNCSQLKALSSAGERVVENTMSLIAQLSTRKLESWLKKQPEKVLISYGGALHNDLYPAAGRASWSYAQEVNKLSNGSFVEIDLIRAQALTPDSPWLRLKDAEWLKKSVQAFLQKESEGALLLRRRPHSYYLVLGSPPQQ